MKFFAIQEIPNGTPAGRIFEATEDEGRVLITYGIARALTEAEAQAAEPELAGAGHAKRTYRRRDLKAEE